MGLGLILSACLMEGQPVNPDPRGAKLVDLPGSYLSVDDCPASTETSIFDRGEALVARAQGFSTAVGVRHYPAARSWASPESPMVMSAQSLRLEIEQLEEIVQSIDDQGLAPRQALELSERTYHLSHKLFRWRYRVCAGARLMTPWRVDTRPFMALSRPQAPLPPSEQIQKAIEVCQSFQSKAHCHGMLHVFRRRGELGDFINHWKERFERERYSRLFELTPRAPKFHCSQPTEGKWQLHIPIHRSVAIRELLGDNYQERIQAAFLPWSSDKLSFKIEWQDNVDDGVLEIRPAQGQLSHVTIEQPFLIRLQETMVGESQVRVISHELGHVFGFPDCYIEFFDSETNELVYYEHDQESGNLMCSLEFGREAPESYRRQLINQSCL